MKGDVIVSVQGKSIETWPEIKKYVQESGETLW